MDVALEPDALDPADVDWRTFPESAVYYAARDGITEAIAELARRNAGTA